MLVPYLQGMEHPITAMHWKGGTCITPLGRRGGSCLTSGDASFHTHLLGRTLLTQSHGCLLPSALCYFPKAHLNHREPRPVRVSVEPRPVRAPGENREPQQST